MSQISSSNGFNASSSNADSEVFSSPSENGINVENLSPMMSQWHSCKQIAKSAVLLFRMGDFYEAFYEDAALISKELDLTLTKRCGVPMSGVPFHTCETYVDKLVSKGYRVAIAEQMEDPKKAKGLVKRDIARIVTPGTLVTSSLLSDKNNNFFASIVQLGSIFAISIVDISTGEFRVLEFENISDLLNEIYRIRPAEILIPHKFNEKQEALIKELNRSFNFLLTTQEDWRFEHQLTYHFLQNHFKVHTLDGFGLKGMVASINAAGALLAYIKENLSQTIEHITNISVDNTLNYLSIDRTTQNNLELTNSLRDGSSKNTLLDLLDKTSTPMGGRLIRQWIKHPLISLDEIHKRQESIQFFYDQPTCVEFLNCTLSRIRDLERLMMKISTSNATPRDLVALRLSFEHIPHLKKALSDLIQANSHLKSLLIEEEYAKLLTLDEMVQKIAVALVDEPPLKIQDGKTFKDGYHPELDELRALSRDGKAWINNYQTYLREQTGIKTLKVGFTRVFGYYIEVSRGQVEKMPEAFQRRQTLANAERYVTQELKEYEQRVMTAEERIFSIETELLIKLRQEIASYSKQVLQVARSLAQIDCLLALAVVARQYNYVRPIVDGSEEIQINDGRHPVIEGTVGGERFIPNDTLLDNSANRLQVITGPNMAGKSTYIRQVALIVIMAQIGSFIPAKQARIGLVDKVFTRIGASDDLARGQSTFMVEMTETANILNNATNRSLVILDEIGRGTSTFDGISIAWAVAEHLLLTPGKMAKTLFATHYWELTKLEGKHHGAVNYHVAVSEMHDNIVFLRKIVRGDTDKSYGIHVARLSGLPNSVVDRAKELLIHLEENANRKSAFELNKLSKPAPKAKKAEVQLVFFDPKR